MDTLNFTSILAYIIAQNPFHIVSLQGQFPMSHAQNTYDFEIAEDDPNYEEISDFSLEMLWVYTYADKESLELDLMEILNQMKKKPKNQVYIHLTRINGMNTFLLQVNQILITIPIQVQPSTSTYVPKTN